MFSTRWEKYDAKGWTEKGAHKYGRLNEQSWWERWGEHYDGRGFVLKWWAFLHFQSYMVVEGVYGRAWLHAATGHATLNPATINVAAAW